MYRAQDIANYFIWRVNSDLEIGDNITNMKLQKLMYYAQGFHLAWKDAPLFAEPIEAWTHGPVVPALYFRYRDAGANPLPTPEEFEPQSIDEPTRDLLEDVYGVYGQYSAWGLRNLTHEELPWKDAWGETDANTEISHDTMRQYFAETLTAR